MPLLVALALLALAPVARAARIGEAVDRYGFTTGLKLTALPGETNRVSTRPADESVVVVDAGAPLTPTGSCVSLDPVTVNCAAPGRLVLGLGDRDDTLRVSGGFAVQAAGDDGRDALSG